MDNIDNLDSCANITNILREVFILNPEQGFKPQFVQVVKRKNERIERKLIIATDAPLEFYVQEDDQNECILHALAKNVGTDCSEKDAELQKLLDRDTDGIIWEKILEKSTRRRDLFTPLEVAMKIKNIPFIGKQ